MTALETLAERVSRGEAVTDADARTILETPDLIAVGVLADDVRRRMHGTRTTFVRVFEMHVDAPPSALPPGVSAGEFRIIGSPASIDAAVVAVRAASALAGTVPVTGFSLPELQALATAEDRTLEELCGSLHTAGLYAIADVPIDLVQDGGRTVEIARHAGLRAARLTVHALADDLRISMVTRARDLQHAIGGFRTLAPLPRRMSVAAPTTGYDDVKQIALARVLATHIDSIQVDWQLYGPKLAQVALTVGADDVDGVAAFDPGTLGTRRSSIEEIRGNIRAAALEPVERDARFEVVGGHRDCGDHRDDSPQSRRR